MTLEMKLDQRFEDGKKAGRAEGEKLGRIEGEKMGRIEGEKIGRIEGEKIGIAALVETCQELGVSETDTIARLVQKFELTREKAEEAYKRYTV